jgi:hypothetical protein
MLNRVNFSLIILFAITTVNLIAEPTLFFPKGTTIDWGIVKPKDHPLNAEIELKNTGSDTLVITHVQPTCGCTNAPLTKNILAPGESTSMIITLSISSYQGEIQKSIRIFSNDPKNSVLELTLKANIKRDIFVTPSSFVSFTDIRVGETSNQTLTLNNNSDMDVIVNIGSISPANIRLNLKDGQIIKKKESYPLVITFSPSEVGVLKGKILLLTNNPDYPDVPIFLFGDIKASPLFIGN